MEITISSAKMLPRNTEQARYFSKWEITKDVQEYLIKHFDDCFEVKETEKNGKIVISGTLTITKGDKE